MIYAIGDLHFDHSKQKPMDVFGENWINHKEKIVDDWKSTVFDDDLVLVPGDISWALKLDEAVPDLKLIDSLPGHKLFIKGNHDYWWESISRLKSLDLESITFIRNNSYLYKNVGIGGTRGWMSRDSEGFDEGDEKIYKRELLRLDASLSSMEDSVSKKIAMLHYPPFDGKLRPNDFVDVLVKHNVDTCIYGHLHAEGLRYAVEGIINGVDFKLVSSDYLDFKLKIIEGDWNEDNSNKII
ncbi:metallophosphoesterase [Gudongella sp. DL1XJH-153]|uniref:metallophosphoesterase n=1 Tax=Gudongella sp. DL1XJH-153 TaxID=3409804 RepID=UPI003BB7F04B